MVQPYPRHPLDRKSRSPPEWAHFTSLLVKFAPHPNAAKLWIEWSLSEEGQNLLAQQGYAVVRQGIQAKEPEASLEGVKFLPRDDDFTKFQLIPERTKRWEAAFFKTS